MSELTPEREAEIRECLKSQTGLTKSSCELIFAALDAARRERDAWRAATGLASLTPEQAGERIDAMDDRLAAAEKERDEARAKILKVSEAMTPWMEANAVHSVLATDAVKMVVEEANRLKRYDGDDEHPENRCGRCGGRNLHNWYADSDVWNHIVGDKFSIICPNCLNEMAAECGEQPTAWRVSKEGDDAEIDKLRIRLAEAEGVVVVAERLANHLKAYQPVGGHAPYVQDEIKLILARVAAWREGKQPVTGGDMTFADFSRTNRERAVAWNGADPPPVEFAAMELAGEVGELCNAIKKSVRLKHGMAGGSIDIDNIRDELGDVVICADLIASRFGVDLGEAVARKFDKTSEKHGFPHRLASIGGKQ